MHNSSENLNEWDTQVYWENNDIVVFKDVFECKKVYRELFYVKQ